MKNNDTSSISFTAHYTGYVWYKNRLSHQAFATKQGFAYYQLLKPIEVLAKGVIGSDIKTTLLQRHQLLDRELTQLIHQHPDLQVLELACGLSPRGWRINKKYPYIHYVEADLQGMAEQKHQLLNKLSAINPTHKVSVCNILVQDNPDSLESLLQREFNPNKPLVVITEGLVNYFKLDDIMPFWSRLAQALKAFPAGFYLTDVYPKVTQHRFYHWIQFANKTLKVSSRSSFSMHFEQTDEAALCFKACGFQQTTVFNPDIELNERPTKGGALVWVLRAEV
ncbi:class I SAM-dependent methyltransferase [Agitococcus lubricus]|uniref:O-methyltransferase involved in polyketide biosynthesis n=1 Tax=Agitococcus lubricus TaxID=1077255 RepID=A0A2T5J1T4_9GAMM|nr:class I SAM-dependent methyltransferase [Agitococcus lubricus]PTQ90405.1 O-methyltransferase involved in polyketide biosynthesis [Agitococcus lubricus]